MINAMDAQAQMDAPNGAYPHQALALVFSL